MVSTHGYVAANPPLGAADPGGQVAYVLELSNKLAQLGYEVDLWTRRFEDQLEIEPVAEQVRIIRAPCGGKSFIAKEYLHEQLPQWSENALRFINKHGLKYEFISSHYWDAGVASQHLCEVLGVPHLHTPHSLGAWKKRQRANDYPGAAVKFEKQYNFAKRIHHERLLYESANMVRATTPPQQEFLLSDYEVSPEKCRMIPPGSDDNRFFPVNEATERSLRQKLGFTGSVVMAVGRLARNKGYDLLVQGFQLVSQRNPAVTLYLAAGGTNAKPLEEQILAEQKALVAQLGRSEHLWFGNFIPDD